MARGVTSLIPALLDRIVAADPVTATQLGLSTGLDRLPSYSEASVGAYLRSLHDLEPELALAATADDVDEAIDARIGETIVRRVLRDLEARRLHRSDPVLYLDAAYGILLAMIKDVAPVDERVAAVAGRLQAFSGLLEEGIDNLDGPLPRVFIQSALDEVAGTHALVSEAVRGFARDAGREGALDAPARSAGLAVERFAHHLRERLLPNAVVWRGAGRPLVVDVLRNEHLLTETPEEIAAVGRRIIAETKAAMRELAAEMGYESTVAAVESVQAAHPANAAALLASYREAVASARAFVCEHDLVTMPAVEQLTVDFTPEFMRASLPFAGYEGPGPFEAGGKGFYWVTAPAEGLEPHDLAEALAGHPFASMPTIGAHEAYPGHHIQFLRAATAGTPARRIAHIPMGGTLLIEGWAFYCEEMMEREGFLADPAVRLMRLNDQLWRACRVVIDIEVNVGSMSYDEAVDLLVGDAHLARAGAESEVRWYLRAPGYPMSHLIGKRELMALAHDWSHRHTTSAKAFHDAVLDWGATPPALIRWGMGLGPRPS
jgi:uncharacterized protein (DUF885 family)